MKLSIFPSVSPLPKGKEEKHQESKKASQCSTVDFMNDDQLADFVCTYAWSPFIFRDNKRLAANFLSTDLLVYDIDDGMTIDKATEIVEQQKLCALILPSTSHTPEHHKFRIILPLARTITSPEIYQETWRKHSDIFGVVDEQCKDTARFFFSCRDDDGFWIEGDFIEPLIPAPVAKDFTPSQTYMIEVTEDLDQVVEQIYGEKRTKIPEAVDYFVRNAHTGLPGNWVNSLNRFVFSLTLSGVDDTLIEEVCEKLAPQSLDNKDLYQIKRAIRDGKNAI